MKTLKRIIIVLLLIDMILIPASGLTYFIGIIGENYFLPLLCLWIVFATLYITIEYREEGYKVKRRLKRSNNFK